MDGDFHTVSLGNWMELPNLKFSDVMVAANSSKRVKVSSVVRTSATPLQCAGAATAPKA